MIEAVLFDMDDVLVETEDVDHDVALRICKDLGISLTREEEAGRLGVKTKEFYERLSRNRNASLDVNAAVAQHFALYEKKLAEELKILPGAMTVPFLLRSQGYRLALVSGSTKRQVATILSRLRLESTFEVIVTAEDVVRGKPDAEGYALAAKKLRVRPGNCVVVEDAPPGIAAAKNAGMIVIGVTNGRNRDLFQADILVEDLTKIDISSLQ